MEAYVQKEKHLPGIPSADEIETNGQDLGDLQLKLLVKIEELLLYTIQQQKEIKALKEELGSLKKK